MQLSVTFFACLLCVHYVYGAQSLSYSTTHSGNTVQFDIRIYKDTDTVTGVVIPNTDTGQIDVGTSANACKYTVITTPVTLVDGTTNLGKTYVEFSVRIDYTAPMTPVFETTTGDDLNCFFKTVDAAAGEFSFYVRGLSSLTGTAATDREYLVRSFTTDSLNVFVAGDTVFQGPPVLSQTAAQVTAYTFSMNVVDSPAHADQTSMDLGKTAQLKFTMTINPYEPKMDLAGARVTNCIVDKVATFNSPAITFIGADGCFDNVDIYDNVNLNVGFSRDGSSSESGGTKTYIAFSPKFEMSAFTKNPVNDPNALFFKCDITLCLDDTDSTTAGQCGASHCDSARKKRDVLELPEASVIASVNITAESARIMCSKCSETPTFQVSVGVLSTFAAVLFGLMTLSFTGARNAAIHRFQNNRKLKTGSSFTQRSTISSAARSVKGSDVTSNGISVHGKSFA